MKKLAGRSSHPIQAARNIESALVSTATCPYLNDSTAACVADPLNRTHLIDEDLILSIIKSSGGCITDDDGCTDAPIWMGCDCFLGSYPVCVCLRETTTSALRRWRTVVDDVAALTLNADGSCSSGCGLAPDTSDGRGRS